MHIIQYRLNQTSKNYDIKKTLSLTKLQTRNAVQIHNPPMDDTISANENKRNPHCLSYKVVPNNPNRSGGTV